MILTLNASSGFDSLPSFGPFDADAFPAELLVQGCRDDSPGTSDAFGLKISAYAVERAEVSPDRQLLTITADDEKQGVPLLRDVEVVLSNNVLEVNGGQSDTRSVDNWTTVRLPVDGRLCIGRYLKVVVELLELDPGQSARLVVGVRLKGW